MKQKRISRRSFLRHAAVAAAVGSAATVMGPSVGRLWASQTTTSRQAQLLVALTTALGDQVGGIEKRHDIAHRLAINLATMRGPHPEMVARQQILLLAAQQIPKGHQPAPGTQPKSVSQNLNDLLNTIRGQRGASQLIASVLKAVATTVLFSTHGVQFDDTKEAHKAFRQAVLDLKQRNSDVSIGTRIRNKRRLLVDYRRAILSHVKDVTLGGFPAAATIESVWVMTDYKFPSSRKR